MRAQYDCTGVEGEAHAAQIATGLAQALEEAVFLRVRLVSVSGLHRGLPAGSALERQEPVTGHHLAERPSWRCRTCGRDWPCDPARARLAGEMDRVRLATYMWANMDDAIPDMPGSPPAELFERFIGWTH